MEQMEMFNKGDKYYKEMKFPSICVYHGSNTIIEKPQILTNSYTKDFGYGFYLTKISKQAESWAKRKSRFNGIGVVSVYDLELRAFDNLICKKFQKMDKDWLDFIANCRANKKYIHGYDIIEGPMADDTVYNYVNDYLSGAISESVFLDICKFKNETHQIALTSDKALEFLKYRRSYYV